MTLTNERTFNLERSSSNSRRVVVNCDIKIDNITGEIDPESAINVVYQVFHNGQQPELELLIQFKPDMVGVDWRSFRVIYKRPEDWMKALQKISLIDKRYGPHEEVAPDKGLNLSITDENIVALLNPIFEKIETNNLAILNEVQLIFKIIQARLDETTLIISRIS